MKQLKFVVTLTILLGLAYGTLQAGTTGKITGVVTDAKTKETLPGAVVVILGTGLGANTDIDGRYVIINVPVGTYSVQAKMMGYETMTITNIKAIMDLTSTVNFKLSPSIIEKEGVIIVGERKKFDIIKDATSTTKTISTEEIESMSGVNTYQDVVARQAGVSESQGGSSGATGGLHIRGGRANEVAYFVDGLSTQDQVIGGAGANINTNAIKEVLVVTGGFNAEYGEAMSGVVNLVTKSGSNKHEGMVRYKTDAMTPKDDNLHYGYNGVEANIGGPIPMTSFMKYFLSGEVNRREYTYEWYRYPHTEREFYSGQGKLLFDFKQFKTTFSGFASRTQNGAYIGRDYVNDFKYSLPGHLSTLRNSQQVQANATHMLNKDLFYQFNIAYFSTKTTTGVRKDNATGFAGLFEDYEFKTPVPNSWFKDPTNPYYNGDTTDGYRDYGKTEPDSNPYGVSSFFYSGDYPYYSQRQSSYVLGKLEFTYQASFIHQLKAGFESRFNKAYYHSVSYPAQAQLDADNKPVYLYFDEYTYKPVQMSSYLQDKIEYQNLIVNIGARLDLLQPDAERLSDIYDRNSPLVKADTKFKVSPRLGVSFPVTEFTALRFSYGQFFQVPELQYLYENIGLTSTGGFVLVGNPDLNAQQTDAFEVGLQHQFSPKVLFNITSYYKDMKHLLGTRQIIAAPNAYYLYQDADYGNVKGIEFQLDAQLTRNLRATTVYTLSVARGSGSYVREAYYYNYAIGATGGGEWVVPKQDYYLEFDQRHNILVDLTMTTDKGDGPKIWKVRPLEELNVNLTNRFGSGLPYSRTDISGKRVEDMNASRLPWTISNDLRVSRDFSIWKLNYSLVAEVTNIFNVKNIDAVYPVTGKPDNDGWLQYGKLEAFRSAIPRYLPDGSPNPSYSYKADTNRDDYISADEHYAAALAAHYDLERDGLNGYHLGESRQFKLALSMSF